MIGTPELWAGAATVDSRMVDLVEDCRHGRLVKNQRYGTEPA